MRLDTHLYQGYSLPIYYDSLIAKLIAYDATRAGAIGVMTRALAEFSIGPIKTTIPLFQRIMVDEQFSIGTVGQSPAAMGVRIVSKKLGNIPARQVNAQHARPPFSSHPATFFYKA